MKFPLALLASAMAAAGLPGCGPAAPEGKRPVVSVLAAASTGDVVEQLAQRFEQQHPALQVRVSTGASNSLARQILAGAPADLFLSANIRWADVVVESGLAAERVDVLSNRLVLVVPRGNPAGVQNVSHLAQPQIERVAIAAENVPAGMYAEQALADSGLLESLERTGRLVRAADVRSALSYVACGEVEAGFVYQTDAEASAQVEVIEVLDSYLDTPVVYSMVWLGEPGDATWSRDFFNYLQTAEAHAMYRQFGFEPLGPGSAN